MTVGKLPWSVSRVWSLMAALCRRNVATETARGRGQWWWSPTIGGLEQTERIGVKRGGLLDEDLGEGGKDTPVAIFVGIGQRAAGGGLADAGVVEFRAEGRQAGFAVAQTFAPSQLGEGEHEELS